MARVIPHLITERLSLNFLRFVLRALPALTTATSNQKNCSLDQVNKDLTCHLCWDWIEEDILKKQNFINTRLLRQESLFMRYSQDTIRSVTESNNSEDKGQLKELLHPAYLGLKFQALYGHRLAPQKRPLTNPKENLFPISALCQKFAQSQENAHTRADASPAKGKPRRAVVSNQLS